jgi:hypothetical protein
MSRSGGRPDSIGTIFAGILLQAMAGAIPRWMDRAMTIKILLLMALVSAIAAGSHAGRWIGAPEQTNS